MEADRAGEATAPPTVAQDRVEMSQALALPTGRWARGDSEQSMETPGQSDLMDALALRWNNDAIALAQQQRYDAAVQKLRYARARQPEAAVLKSNLQRVLTAWGLERMRAQDFAKARDLLEEAHELGSDPDVAYALGIVWSETGGEHQAQLLWEAMLEYYPGDPRFLLALAELYERQGLRAEALDLYARARAAGVAEQGLEEHIRRLEREVDAEWDLSLHTSSHFRLRFPDRASADEVRAWTEAFESARDHVASFLGMEGPKQLEIVLYDNRHFRHVTRAPGWAAGAFSGRIQLPVDSARQGLPELQRVARHELAHAFLATVGGKDAPAWLNEGLALHAEEEVAGEKRPWAIAAVRSAPMLVLDRLPDSFLSLEREEAQGAYGLAYLAVATLLEQKGVELVLQLLRVPRAATFAEHFRTQTGQSWADFSPQVHARAE